MNMVGVPRPTGTVRQGASRASGGSRRNTYFANASLTAGQKVNEFERCWPWLEASLNEFGATHTKDQVRDAIRHGAVLWPGENAVILTTMVTYPIGIRCCSVWLQGGELEELKAMYPTIEKYARAQGCDWLIGWGRDGWLKAMPGWQSCGTRRKKVLTE